MRSPRWYCWAALLLETTDEEHLREHFQLLFLPDLGFIHKRFLGDGPADG